MKNKKLLVSLIAFMAVCSVSFAQSAFSKGEISFSAGLGFGNADVSLPVSIDLDYGLSNKISLGAHYTGDYVNWDYSVLGLVSKYHLMTNERFDPYVGAILGYKSYKSGRDLESVLEDGEMYKDESGFVFSGFIGAKYLITNQIGVFGELGFGVSTLTLGVVKKF